MVDMHPINQPPFLDQPVPTSSLHESTAVPMNRVDTFQDRNETQLNADDEANRAARESRREVLARHAEQPLQQQPAFVVHLSGKKREEMQHVERNEEAPETREDQAESAPGEEGIAVQQQESSERAEAPAQEQAPMSYSAKRGIAQYQSFSAY